MIAQLILTGLLLAALLYAWIEYPRSPAVGLLTVLAAWPGLFFVWFPEQATRIAGWVGIGRGVDLVIYVWIGISLIVLLNLHLKLRAQMELITVLARKIAIAGAGQSQAQAQEVPPAGKAPATAAGDEAGKDAASASSLSGPTRQPIP
jgi:small membrane protein